MTRARECLLLHHHKGLPNTRMKESILYRNQNTVEPVMIANDRKITLHAIHNDAVIKAANSQERNVVLDDRPSTINAHKGTKLGGNALPSPNSDLDIANSWAITRVGLRKMLASRMRRLWQRTSLRQASLCFPGSFNVTDTVRFMEQTNGCILRTQL